MSRLNFRENTVLFDSNSEPNWGAGYRAIALPIGAVTTASSTGTSATVAKGHGFRATQKFCTINEATSAVVNFGTVDAVAATTLTLDTSYTLASGDVLINLGADTGSASPNWDGSPVAVWTSADKSTAATNSTVTADSVGRYFYYHQGSNFWELIQDSSVNPVHVITGIGVAEPGEVNVVDFGARPDDSTVDSGPAINAAIAAIESLTSNPNGEPDGAMGGTVILPVDDEGAYGIGTQVRTTYGIGFEGRGGWARLVCTTNGLDYMLGIDSHNGNLGGRMCCVQRLLIDGSNDNGVTRKAAIGIYLGRVNLITLKDIRIQRCSDAGLVVDRTQNSIFINIDCSQNGDAGSTLGAGVRYENGAGNNNWIGGQIRNNIPYNLVFREATTQTAYSTYNYGNGDGFSGDGPTGNVFVGPMIEELADATGISLVYFRAGRDNRFDKVQFRLGSQTAGNGPKGMIRITDDDFVSGTITRTRRNQFHNCTINGTSTTAGITDAFWIKDAAYCGAFNCIFENVDNLIDWNQLTPTQGDATQEFWLVNPIVISAGTYLNATGITDLDIALKAGGAGGGGVGQHDFFGNSTGESPVRVGTNIDGTKTVYTRLDANGDIAMRDPSGSAHTSISRVESGSTWPVIAFADFFSGGVTAGITASVTSAQAATTADTLSKFLNEVTVVGTAGDSVTLPPARAGLVCVVVNAVAAAGNSLDCFPASGDTINDLAVNVALAVPDQDILVAFAVSNSQWYAFVTDLD